MADESSGSNAADVVALGSVGYIQGGYAFRSACFVDVGTPVVRMSDLRGGRLDLSTAARVAPDTLVALRSFALRAGDLLLGMSGSLGNHAVVASLDLPAYLNQRVGRLVADDVTRVDYGYLRRVLTGHAYSKYAYREAVGVAQLNISSGQIESFPLRLPPLPEQRQIAAILDTIDDGIRKTEQLIAKLKQVKRGLLQDLLTRGIDDNGELRDPERHPEQFKDSPRGRIPRGWEVIPLADAASVTVGYVGPTNPFYTPRDNGVLFLRTGNITVRGIDCSDVRWVTRSFHASQPKSALRAGDVVVSRVGYTGTAAVVPDLGPVNCANMIIIRCSATLLAAWVRRLFESFVYGTQVASFTAGSAQPVLNIQLVARLLTPIASRTEQSHVVSLLAAHENRAELEEAHLAKLGLLKAGLMEDLLTGRVRVTKLLESSAE